VKAGAAVDAVTGALSRSPAKAATATVAVAAAAVYAVDSSAERVLVVTDSITSAAAAAADGIGDVSTDGTTDVTLDVSSAAVAAMPGAKITAVAADESGALFTGVGGRVLVYPRPGGDEGGGGGGTGAATVPPPAFTVDGFGDLVGGLAPAPARVAGGRD